MKSKWAGVESLERRTLFAAISSGETQSLAISGGDIDTLTFSANAGNWIVVSAATTSGFLDPLVDLYAPNGGPLATDNANQVGGVDISLRAPATGTYTITVRDNGGGDAGQYNVSLLVIPTFHVPDTNGDGGAIANGQTRAGSIEMRSDIDVFTIDALVGDVITLVGVTSAGTLDPKVTLFGPTGFADSPMSDTGSELGDAQVQYAVPLAGLYTIVVRDHDADDTGTYNLTLTQIPGGPPPVMIYDRVAYVHGTSARDLIAIADEGDKLRVSLNGKITRLNLADVRQIHVDAGAGDDVVSLADTAIRGYVYGGAGNDRIAGGSGADSLTGGSGRDRIDGNVGDDRLNGAGGHDVLQGGLDRDRLYGGDGNDLLSGLSHVDRLFGEDGNDTLVGGTSNDKLFGGADDDLLVGNSGTDILDGGADHDRAKDDPLDSFVQIEELLS